MHILSNLVADSPRIQFIAPLLFMMAPVVYSVVIGFFDSHPTRTTGIAYVLSMSLYGYTNATLTVVFVTPYRRRTLENIRWIVATVGMCRLKTAGQLTDRMDNAPNSVSFSAVPQRQLTVVN